MIVPAVRATMARRATKDFMLMVSNGEWKDETWKMMPVSNK